MAKRKATPRVMPRVTKKEATHIRALRAEGVSILRIAVLTKRSPSTVRKHAAPLEPVAPPPAEPVAPPPAEPVAPPPAEPVAPPPAEPVAPVEPVVATLPPQDGIIARIRKWIFGV